MGVVIGLMPGSWLCNQVDSCQAGLTSSLSKEAGMMAILFLLLKLVIGKDKRSEKERKRVNLTSLFLYCFEGVACLFIWRIACKKLCYYILPPIYRIFNLPHRKFEIGAR